MKVVTLTTIASRRDLGNLVKHLESQSVCPDYSVIVDDTPEGDVERLLIDYAKQCHKYVLVRSESRGRSSALNAGMAEISNGDLVAIWDADDHYFTDRISVMRKTSENFTGEHSEKIVIQKIIYPTLFGCQVRPLKPHQTVVDFRRGVLAGDSRVAFPSFAFVKSPNTPSFDEAISASVDFVWLSQLVKQSIELHVDQNPVGVYSRIRGSISSRKRLRQYSNVYASAKTQNRAKYILGLASLMLSAPIRHLESLGFITNRCVKKFCSCE